MRFVPVCHVICGAVFSGLLGALPAKAQSEAVTLTTIAASISPGSEQTGRASPDPLARRISLDLVGVPLVQALWTISEHAGLRLTFSSDDLSPTRRVSLSGTDISVGMALQIVLASTPLRPVVMADGAIVLTKSGVSSGAKRVEQPFGTVVALVTDATTNQPLLSASVRIEGTELGAATTATGLATIAHVPVGTYQVSAHLVGYRAGRAASVAVVADSTTRVAIPLTIAPGVLEQVQVTATKSPVSVGDVPALTNTVSEQQIEERGDARFTQAIEHVPGLINSALEGQFESVLLRGMPREGNEWTSTLLLIDGIPQTDSRNSARVINLPIDDINNVEVVRGPNSALYGRTAIGGVVNVLTPEPTASPRFDVDLTGGQFDLWRVKAAASGPVSDWGGYYVSGAEGGNHGFYRQPYTFTIKDNGAFAKLVFTPDRQSRGSVSVNTTTSDNALPTPLPIVDGVLVSDLYPGLINRYRNFNLPSANYHQEETRTALNYERDIADWLSGTGILGFRHIVYQFQNDGDELGSPFDTVAHTFTQYPFEETSSENIYYSEARFAVRPAIRHVPNELLVGTSYEHTSGFITGNLIYTDTTTFGWPLNYFQPIYPDRTTWKFLPFGGNQYTLGVAAVYGQYRITPWRPLTLTFGERYDNAQLSNLDVNDPTHHRVSNTYHAFSPKASATVHLLGMDSSAAPGLRLNAYATYSGAFVPPRTPSELNPSDSLNLQPEHVTNYEAGFKGDAFGSRVSFDAGYFWMRIDGIVVDTRQGPFFIPSNAGIENFQGFEGSVSWTPTAALSLYANLAEYHNRFGRFVIQGSGGNTVLTGNRLPISPDNIENAGATFQIWRGLGVTANFKRVGPVFLDQGNTFLFHPYGLVDASVFWRRGPAAITVAARNLFDARYFTMGDIELAQSADPAPTRQLVVTTSFRLH